MKEMITVSTAIRFWCERGFSDVYMRARVCVCKKHGAKERLR